VPLGSVFVEVEDVKGTVAAFDFAIAVKWMRVARSDASE
jgi:hypothetical protein